MATRALPSTGSLSMSQIRTEVKLTGQLSLGHSAVRKLGNKPSGQIAYSDLRGKSNVTLVYKKRVSAYGQDQAPGMCYPVAVSIMDKQLGAYGLSIGAFGLDKNSLFKPFGTKTSSAGHQLRYVKHTDGTYQCSIEADLYMME